MYSWAFSFFSSRFSLSDFVSFFSVCHSYLVLLHLCPSVLCLSLSVCLYVGRSLSLSLCLSVSLSLSLSLSLSVSLCLSICHFRYIFFFLSLPFSVYNSVFLSYAVGLFLFVFFGSFSPITPSLSLSFYLLSLSLSPPVRLSSL